MRSLPNRSASSLQLLPSPEFSFLPALLRSLTCLTSPGLLQLPVGSLLSPKPSQPRPAPMSSPPCLTWQGSCPSCARVSLEASWWWRGWPRGRRRRAGCSGRSSACLQPCPLSWRATPPGISCVLSPQCEKLHRKVVFALIESWPWAREQLEMEMAKQALENSEAKQRMA